jgi:hypothetical protein
MNRRRGRTRRIALVFAVLAVFACLVLVVSALLYYRQQQTRAQNEAPTVIITYPTEGASVLADSYLSVSASAFGGIPITRLELWLDGEVIDTQESSVVGGISPFDASFELLVSQGLHTLFVRAVNAVGLIGDSWPLNVGGVERPSADEPARLVTVATDQTLEDIAADYDANPDTTAALNPGLAGPTVPAGSTVVVPPPQSKTQPGPGAPPGGPTVPGGPPVGPTIPPTGTVPSPPGPPLGNLTPGWPNWVATIIATAPQAPTNLQATVNHCKVRLSWNDNANNEDRYEVWYTYNIFQVPRLIAKLNPAKGGQVWYEFDMGWGSYIFWVEAVNSVGRQKSNPAAAVVSATDCAQTLATQLQVEALDMTVPAGYSQVYCFVRFEGAQHVRVPAAITDFIQVTGGKGNISSWATGNNKLVVPIPADESLEITGECWGWSGGKLSKFGTFSGNYPRSTWDGKRRPLPGTGFEIGVAIKPLGGSLDTSGQLTTYSYEDPTLPVPYDVVEHKLFSPWPTDPLERSLGWKYDNPKNATITGFQILLNGAPYAPAGGWSLVAPTARSADVRLPKDCGQHITWQVRAIAGEAQSKLSALKKPDNDYDLPKCPVPMYAMVKFDKITFIDDCDDLDLYWYLKLNGVTKQFYWSCDPGWFTGGCLGTWPHIGDDCGPHSVASLGQGENPFPDTVVASLGQTAAGGTSGAITIEIYDDFVNTLNFWGGDDSVGRHKVVYNFASLAEAQQKLGCGREVCVGPGTGDPYASQYVGHDASICYTLYIFPQAEGSNCPVKQPTYTP